MRGIRKKFPGVLALDGVDLTVGPGEVVALLGENGAGKSTLMKILGGVHVPDAGEILIDGQTVTIGSVAAAQRYGVGFIHQELNVVDSLDIAANVFLGREPVNAFGLIDRRRIHAETVPFLRRLGLDLAPDTPLARLSIAQQQLVEIAKALSLNARLLIMDEPTSSLTLTETDCLLTLIGELKRQDVSIVYISHRLAEVERCADRAVGLRDGKNAGELARDEITHDRMVRLMVGREIKPREKRGTATATAAPTFRARDVRTRRFPRERVSFDAAAGEILGFAGLVGSGRSELAEAIFGVDAGCGGEVSLDGATLRITGSGDAIRAGIYLAPEDRRLSGLVTAMSVRENISLASVAKYARFGLIDRKAETATAETCRRDLGIKTPTVETLVSTLSGGNQQKVVLGKWLSMTPRVIFFDEPTRGIDVGAKAEIYTLMQALCARGVVVIMISSDMEEVLTLSDRVAVMHEGKISGVLAGADCTEENIMQLAVGSPVAAARPPATNS
jgi:ribose transport system ATP-binding protein